MTEPSRATEGARGAEPLVAPSGSPRPATGRPDRLTLAAFSVLVVLVAANVIAIKFTNRELPPFWGASTRFIAASAVFFIYAFGRHIPLPRGRALAGTLLFGVLQFGVGFALGYWSLQEVPAGLASVILAAVPLFTLFFARAARLEPLHARGVLGSLIAIAGIALLFGELAGRDVPLTYLLAAVGTAACFALAGVVVKLVPGVHLAMMNGIGMLTGALLVLGLSLATGEAPVIPQTGATWIAQIYLVLPGSVGVFGLLLFVLRRWTATGVSYQTVLSPVVAIVLSAWLLGEPLTGGLLVGTALILVGVYVGALAR